MTPGTTTLDQAFQVGCMVRVSGGSLGGLNNTQTLDDVNGYAFWILGAGVGTGTFQATIVRYNAGSATVVATSSLPYSTFGNIDASVPFDLRFSAVDESGNVRLRGYITTTLVVGGASVPIVEFPLLNALDSSASKITTAGRVGLISTSLETPATNQFVGQPVSRFRIQSVNAAGAVTGTVVEDEFKRTCPQKGYVNGLGTKGALYAADSTFLGDMRGWWAGLGFAATAKLENGTTGTGTIEFVSSYTSFAYYYTCASQRPTSDDQHHHPEATFQWSIGGVTQPKIGVFGYVSAIPTPGNFMLRSTVGILADCYALWADYTAGELYVERCVKNGGKVRLATYATSFSLTTDYRIGLQITPTTGAGAATSLVIYLGGLPVVPTLDATAPAGVSVNGATAEIIDASSGRYSSGQLEGLAFYDQVAGKTIKVTKWDEGTLSPPTSIADMTSIVFADEGTPSATFQLSSNRPVPLRSPVSYEHGHDIVTAVFDSGHTHAHSRMPARKVWPRLETVPVDRNDRDELRTFWRAREGGVEPFYWTSPDDDTQYTVKFLPDSWEEQEVFRDIWVVRFGLEQVL